MICLTSKKGIDMIENMDLLSIITQKYLNVKNFSQDRLIDYLIFVYENAKQESQKGSENHHIAPEGDFPEYLNFKLFPDDKSTISKLIPEIDSHLLQIMTKRLLKETESKIKINYIHEKYRNYLKQFNTYQEIGIKCMLIEDFLNIENKEFYQWV